MNVPCQVGDKASWGGICIGHVTAMENGIVSIHWDIRCPSGVPEHDHMVAKQVRMFVERGLLSFEREPE